MPGLGVVEVGRGLDAIRRTIRRRCKRVAGDSTVDRIIDSVIAPLVMDVASGHYETIADAANAVGDDLLAVFSRPPHPGPPGRG